MPTTPFDVDHRHSAPGLAAALLATLLLGAATASAAAPDPVAACDGTAWSATTVAGRAAVSCDDGWIRDWQRLRVADASVVRGSSGGAVLKFVVTRPQAGNPLAVAWATADGSALTGTDYVAADGQLVLEADETTATIDVPVTALARAGDDRRLSLTLSDPSGVADFARDHAHGWILNRFYRAEANPDGDYMCDGGFYSLGTRPEGGRSVNCLGRVVTPIVSAPVVDPRAGVATFTITRPPVAGGDSGDYGDYFIAYATADGTARAGVDYTAVSGRAILATFQHSFTVSVPVDPAGSGDGRSFSLVLTTDRPGTSIGVYDAVARVTNPVVATATLRGLGAPVGGMPRAGRELTAAAGAAGYAWSRCDAAGACQPIAGAGAQSYTPTALDVGLTLRVRASAADPDGGTQLAEAAAAEPTRAATPATPGIAGDPADGAVVRSADAGFAFTGKEDDGGYECALDGAAFAACDATLSLTALAIGPHQLSVRQRTVDGLASAAATRAWTVAAASDPEPRTDPDPRTDPEPRTDPQPGPRTDPLPPPGPLPLPQPRTDPLPQPRAGPQPQPGAPLLRVSGRRQQNRSVTDAVAGRTNVVLRCSRRCTLSAPLTISRRDARRLGLRSTTIGRASGGGEGLVRLRVRIDARATQRLLALRAPLTVRARVANPAGAAVTVSFGLKPRAGRR